MAYTLQQLEDAFIAADDAGNTEDAQAFADEIRRIRSGTKEEETSQVAPMLRDGNARQLGLTARDAMRIVTTPAAIVGNAANAVYNFAAMGVNKLFGTELPMLADVSTTVEQNLSKIGFPEEATPGERIVSAAAQTVGVTGLGIGLGQRLAETGGEVAKGVGKVLATAPRIQAASAVAGGAGGQTVLEEGGTPLEATGAAIALSASPYAAAGAGQAALRGAVRGASPELMAENIAKGKQAGTNLTVGEAAGTKRAAKFEGLLAKSQGSQDVIQEAMLESQKNVAKKIDELADELSRAKDPTQAGRAIDRGLDEFTANYKAKAKQLYDVVDSYVPAQTPINPANTIKALEEITAPIKGAESISSGFLRSPQAEQLKQQIINDLYLHPLLNPSAVQGKIDERLASKIAALQDWGQLKTLEAQQANIAKDFHPVPGYPRIDERYAPHTPQAKAAGKAAEETMGISKERLRQQRAWESTKADVETNTVLNAGTVPYESIKAIRTEIGRLMDTDALITDPANAQLGKLYSALSKDMEEAFASIPAKQQGKGEPFQRSPLRAFKAANAYVRASHERVNSILDPLLRKGIPEKIYQATVDTDLRRGATRLNAIMRSLPEKQQRAVASVYLRHMGLKSEGATWDFRVFLNNWKALHEDAKMALFSRKNFGQLRANLDNIAEVADKIENGLKSTSQPPVVSSRMAISGVGLAALTGQYAIAAGILGLVAGAEGSARLMRNPEFVSWVAQTTKLPESALPSQLGILAQMAQRMPDEDKAEVNTMIEKIRKSLNL